MIEMYNGILKIYKCIIVRNEKKELFSFFILKRHKRCLVNTHDN